MELSRDQIVSITMNETQVPEGDNLLTIFYRLKSDVKGSVPFEELRYRAFDATQSWEVLNQDAETLAKKQNILSLTHTAKSIGDINTQYVWYSDDHSTRGTPKQSTLIS